MSVGRSKAHSYHPTLLGSTIESHQNYELQAREIFFSLIYNFKQTGKQTTVLITDRSVNF